MATGGKVISKEDMSATLLSMGVKKKFRPYFNPLEERDGVFYLKVSKPAKSVDGHLTGSDICWSPSYGMFEVWSSKKKLCNALALEHKLQVRLLDGEAFLWVPPSLADKILPKFGAKIGRTMSDEQKQALANRLRGYREARIAPEEGTSSPVTPSNDPFGT